VDKGKFKMKIVITSLIFLFCLRANSRTFSILNYNVENLFDTVHDDLKNDWEYTPRSKLKKKKCQSIKIKRYKKKCLRSNWTKEKLDFKISQIVKVFKSASFPDFISIEEIENKNVLDMLLKKLPLYQGVLIEGDDIRGIDVALLYKRKLKSKKHLQFKLLNCSNILPNINIFKTKKTRPILHCRFAYKSSILNILVNHWPSLGNKNIYRLEMAKTLKNKILSLNKNEFTIAIGDFNTIESLHPHPFYDILLKESNLENIHNRFINMKTILYKQKSMLPPGTYFYPPKMSWNVLDHIFISRNFFGSKTFKVLMESYDIFNNYQMKSEYIYYRKNYLKGSIVRGIPKRFNYKNKDGFSDHFPVTLRFEFLE